MIKLCVFDLDGTLLNTLENITYYVNRTMDSFSLGTLTKEEIREFVGNGAKVLIQKSLAALGTSVPPETVLPEYIRLYDSAPEYLATPYDGIMDMLDGLKKNGIKTAVLSNKPHSSTSMVLDRVFGENCFYKAFGQREGVPKKPDPMAVNEICEGFDKSECLFIGDSPVDIKTGKNAGLKTVGVSWGFRPREELEAAGADCIADSAAELLNIITSERGFIHVSQNDNSRA